MSVRRGQVTWWYVVRFPSVSARNLAEMLRAVRSNESMIRFIMLSTYDITLQCSWSVLERYWICSHPHRVRGQAGYDYNCTPTRQPQYKINYCTLYPYPAVCYAQKPLCQKNFPRKIRVQSCNKHAQAYEYLSTGDKITTVIKPVELPSRRIGTREGIRSARR
jgi:hypothetical protein